MAKVVFILLDGLAYESARRCMSFMLSLEKAGKARHGKLKAGLPPLSRPVYATLLSGLPGLEHGINTNEGFATCRRSTFFSVAATEGLTTCAAAYYWFYELCNHKPFSLEANRFADAEAEPIAHGIFYRSDSYPDTELFADAECLRQKWQPHLLLAHSMGIDNSGHCSGSETPQYRNAVRHADGLLATYLPLWLECGYDALVTSDHGMGMDNCHYDTTMDCREVPIWLVGSHWGPMPQKQENIAATILDVLGSQSNF